MLLWMAHDMFTSADLRGNLPLPLSHKPPIPDIKF